MVIDVNGIINTTISSSSRNTAKKVKPTIANGIGKAIIEDLLEQLKHVSCVHLIATTGKEKFYQKAGLKKLKTAMARYRNRDLAREYLEEDR